MSNSWEDIPASGGGSGSNASVGTNGSGAPGSSTQIAFQNGGGNLTPVSPSNPLPVDIHIDSVTVSENLAQVAGVNVATSGSGIQKVGSVGASGAVLDSAAGTPNSQAQTIQGNASGVPVPVSQATAANLNATIVGTGTLAVQNTQQGTASQNLAQVGGSAISIGQQLAAASLPVILPSATITTLTPPTTVTVTQATGTNLHTVLDSGTITSITNALPTGTNTLGKVDILGNTGTALDSAAGTPNSQAITIQGNSSGVAVPISAASLPLPTGAATDAHLTNVQSAPGTPQTVAITIQGNASGVPVPVSGTITASPASNPASPLFAHVSSTGTAVTLGSGVLVNGVIIQALAGNVGNVYIGGSAVTTSTGFQLQPGQATSAAVANLSALYVIAATSGDGVCYIGS